MFPFQEIIRDEISQPVHYLDVLEQMSSWLTAERHTRIQQVVRARSFKVTAVLEDIYDRGNISAVLRSCEAFGVGQVHLIELGEKFKESQRTTAGADKWVEVKKWKKTEDCVQNLKGAGYQIIATHLAADSKPIAQIDFTKPTAFVLGNEKNGISETMAQMADHRVILPMYGFVQSFNISVAAALGLYHISEDRLRRQGFHGDLTETEQKILEAVYTLRTYDSAEDLMRRLQNEGRLRPTT